MVLQWPYEGGPPGGCAARWYNQTTAERSILPYRPSFAVIAAHSDLA